MRLRRSIGPYELLRVLDTGGMGKVYLAKERRRGQGARHVVVKTIRSELEHAPEHVAAFQRETRILARLQHPNIVQLYDAGRAGTRLYMVMEYLEGLDVAKMVRLLGASGQRPPLGLVARVGVEAARALHAAHAYTTDSGKLAGLVHRDLSPHNVFVLYDGRVKLLDFGLARAYGESATTGVGMVKGKFRYLAPEQARSEALDGRVDIFTLGLVLHEMITGRRAYEQQGDVEVLRAAMQGQFPRLSALAPKTPGPLLRVIERAVRASRDERYPSAAAMADDLAQAAAELGLPVGAEDQHAFMQEMRALADASPLATPVEPSGRLSSNIRSSLASVADVGAAPGDAARPGRRLGLWAGGLGAMVGAIAAIVNVVASRGDERPAPVAAAPTTLAPAGPAPASEHAPGVTNAANERAPGATNAANERAAAPPVGEFAPATAEEAAPPEPPAPRVATSPGPPARAAAPDPPTARAAAPAPPTVRAVPVTHAAPAAPRPAASVKAGGARPQRRAPKRLPAGVSQDRR